jgi:hypothetical protein
LNQVEHLDERLRMKEHVVVEEQQQVGSACPSASVADLAERSALIKSNYLVDFRELLMAIRLLGTVVE